MDIANLDGSISIPVSSGVMVCPLVARIAQGRTQPSHKCISSSVRFRVVVDSRSSCRCMANVTIRLSKACTSSAIDAC